MKTKRRMTKKWSAYLTAAVLGALFVAGQARTESKHVLAAGSAVVAQETFSSPTDAADALQQAIKSDDENALSAILGPDGKTVLNSGDPAEDKAALQAFARKYDRMNRLVAMTDGSQMLNIGADNYSFPIPLVKNGSSKWYFDTKAGANEILARRIGENELLAIDAISSIGTAEDIYFRKHHNGQPKHEYAAQIISAAGKQDGLYWETPIDEETSPLVRLNEFAAIDVSVTPGAPFVVDGYSYRILAKQGDKAEGGAQSYITDGKMSGGFAIIASPVTYLDSGIMTFIMNREGVVYQRDLGPRTSELAASMKEYNPSDDWIPVEQVAVVRDLSR